MKWNQNYLFRKDFCRKNSSIEISSIEKSSIEKLKFESRVSKSWNSKVENQSSQRCFIHLWCRFYVYNWSLILIFQFDWVFLAGNEFEKKWPVLMGKWHKNIKKRKMAKNHFWRAESGSRGVFLGVLGASLYWKVVLDFWFGHPKCQFWYPQNGYKDPVWIW